MALSSDRIRSVSNHGEGVELPLAAGAVVHKGGVYGLTAAGYVDSAANSAVKLAGIACTSADNSGGSAGDKTCVLVVRDHTEWFPVGSFTAADSGAVCFSTDDDTIADTGTLALGTFGPIKDGQIAVFVGSFPYVAPEEG